MWGIVTIVLLNLQHKYNQINSFFTKIKKLSFIDNYVLY
ncbi:hypothetical protein XBO1_140001 [Xenorhabdus bovienii str. oregonense]|uniref:Uncharacterized protein n=1 Tax=Xenorhabdus bovienii str. oregonense TaxID=1398202 RepID=A0A077NRT1_XENBV|nr:hypothetical protein XBO1_140001 [Xenorhabdus bovienii str. oregonense]